MTDTVPEAEAETTPGGELVQPIAFSDDDLRSLATIEDVQRLLGDVGITSLATADEMGSGFAIVEDKRSLVGKTLMLVHWTFNSGKFQNGSNGTQIFVTIYAVEFDPR